MPQKSLKFWFLVTVLNLIFLALSFNYTLQKNAEAQTCIRIRLADCFTNGCLPTCPSGFQRDSTTTVGQHDGGPYGGGIQDLRFSLCFENI